MRILGPSIACVMLIGQAAVAEPTYKETVEFIKTNLSHQKVPYGKVNGDWAYHYQTVTFPNRCILVTDDRMKKNGNYYAYFGDKIDFSKVNLDYLDTVTINGYDGSPDAMRIHLKAANKEEPAIWSWTGSEWKWGKYNSYESSLNVRGQDASFYAPKVGRALLHLAKLCGSKGELF